MKVKGQKKGWASHCAFRIGVGRKMHSKTPRPCTNLSRLVKSYKYKIEKKITFVGVLTTCYYANTPMGIFTSSQNVKLM